MKLHCFLGISCCQDRSWKAWSSFRAAVVLPYDAQTLVPWDQKIRRWHRLDDFQWQNFFKWPRNPMKSQQDRCRHRPNSLRYESDLPWTAANQTWQPDFGDRKPDGNHRGWEDHGRSTWSWLKNPPCRQESSTSKAKKADNYTDNIDQYFFHIYIYRIYHMYHRNHP